LRPCCISGSTVEMIRTGLVPRCSRGPRIMRAAGPGAFGDRLRGVIVVLWRAGLRIGEALALAETDLDPGRGAVLIRRGKGGKRREVGMDGWGWRHYSDLGVMPTCIGNSLLAQKARPARSE
jgi:hypothetical protein